MRSGHGRGGLIWRIAGDAVTWPLASLLMTLATCITAIAGLYLALNHDATKRAKAAEAKAELADARSQEAANACLKLNGRINEMEMRGAYGAKVARI